MPTPDIEPHSSLPASELPNEAAFTRFLHRGTLGIALGIGVPALALLALVIYLLHSADLIDRADAIIAKTHFVEKLLIDMETGLRGFQVTSDPRFLEPLKSAELQLDKQMDALAVMVSHQPEQNRAITDLRAETKVWREFQAEALSNEKESASVQDHALQLRGKVSMDRIRSIIESMVSSESRIAAEERVIMGRIRWALVLTLAAAGLAGAPLAVIWLRRLLATIGGSYEGGLARVKLHATELHVTLRSIGDAVVATNAAGEVAFLNPVAERLMGWTTKEAKGRPLSEVFVIFNEQTGVAAENPVERVMRERIVVGLANHTVVRSRNGTETPIEDSAAPILDDAGNILGVILVFHDVGSKREIEMRLEEAEWRSRTALEIGRAGSWLWEVEQDRVTGDAMLSRTFGVPLETCLAGAPSAVFLAAIHEEDRARVEETIRGAVEASGSYETEFRVCDAARVARSIEARGKVEAGAGGATKRLIGFFMDNTEARERSRLLALRADIAAQLASADDLDRSLQACCESLVYHLGVSFARVWTLTPGEEVLALRASAGLYSHIDGPHARVPVGQFKIGRIAQCRQPLLTNEVATDPNISDPEWAKREGMVAFAGYPLLAEDRTVGVLAMFSQKPLSPATLGDLLPLADTLALCIERKRAEITLREVTARAEKVARTAAHSAERFRVLAEVVSLQVWTAQVNGELDFANQECANFFGTEDLERDVLGHAWAQYVHEEDAPVAQRCWQESLASGKRYEVEFRLKGIDGEYRWFLVRAQAMRDQAGAIAKWFGTNTDIHALKLAQAEAERASRAKDEFLATLSHELRTPLTPVLMTAAALRGDESLPLEVREQLGMMERNIALEARLIDDLLDLTRIARGKLEVRPQPCDAHSLIGLAIEIVRDDALAKSISIQREFGARHCGLIVDPARFQQVIWNLLRNAVKFTPRGGKIIISTKDEESAEGGCRLHIKVIDSGIGITPAQLESIFLPFDQGTLAGDHRFGGIGLGLAIARAIVDLHGGAIRAESEGANCGATFVVEFPGATPPPAGALETQPLLPSAAPLDSEAGHRSSLRLLLVEDHEPTLRVMSRLLIRAGHQVTPVSTIADALSAAISTNFDCVISDLGLPDGTGTELMEQLRDTYGLTGIALSGYGMDEDLARSRQAGFVTHLIKPVDFHQLERALREFV